MWIAQLIAYISFASQHQARDDVRRLLPVKAIQKENIYRETRTVTPEQIHQKSKTLPPRTVHGCVKSVQLNHWHLFLASQHGAMVYVLMCKFGLLTNF